METVAALLALAALGFGFRAGGVMGALTGAVVVIGVASGLSILCRRSAMAGPRLRFIQCAGGLVGAAACAAGGWYGGWPWGWAWALGGYVATLAAVVAAGYLLGESG